jgi:hypothetical protein
MTFQTTERNEDNSMGKHHMVPSVVNDETKNIQQIIDSQAERLWEINQKVPPKCINSCGQHERATFEMQDARGWDMKVVDYFSADS